VEWESRAKEPYVKGDDSLKSFLVALKNPHNIAASRFELKAEAKDRPIVCQAEWGPRFSGMGVCSNCNAKTDSASDLGFSCRNDTGLDGNVVFTGSSHFQVKEIEMFEITE
jgi:hypothetical protein